MARGVLSGMIWGVAVAGLGLGALSLVTSDKVMAPAPESGSVAPATGAATEANTSEEAPVAPVATEGSTAMPAAPTAPTVPDAPAGAQSEDSPMISQGEPAPPVSDPAAGPEIPASESAPDSGAVPASPEVQTEAGAAAATAPGTGEQPETGPEASDATPATPAPAPGGAVPELSESATDEVQPDPALPPAAPGLPGAGAIAPGTPAGQIGDLAENVTTNRLPSIGAAPADAEAAPLVVASADNALRRNAQSFENPEGHPVMAVLLMDVGAERTQLGDLKNLPFPISFVVDAAAEDAAEASRFYRAAGAEVVLSVAMPEGASPSDVEVILQAYAPLMADSVAVMAPKDVGFQTLGAAATQVAAVLAASGHGLITIPQGLNTGHKIALKEGVAAGLVFRELDNDGQSGAVIRRFMDNAAFKARIEGGVIMFGHARVETIQALIEWSLGNRAQSVALAPVSTVLSGE